MHFGLSTFSCSMRSLNVRAMILLFDELVVLPSHFCMHLPSSSSCCCCGLAFEAGGLALQWLLSHSKLDLYA